MNRKPIRVFLQDGSNDNNIYGGSWWNANQSMLSSLQWAGYQVKHEWGEGGHNGKHGAAIFPDAMRWLWSDFDQPITTDVSDHPEVKDRLIDGESWELISDGHNTRKVRPSPQMATFSLLTDPPEKSGRLPPVVRKQRNLLTTCPGISALMFDAQGRLYCARNKAMQMTRIDPDGKRTDLMSGVSCNDLVVLQHGIYFTGPTEQAIWYLPIDKQGNPRDGGKPIKAGQGPRKAERIDRDSRSTVSIRGRRGRSLRVVV